MANTIKVSILGEVRDINSKLGQVNSSLGKVGKVAKLAGGVLAAAFAGKQIVSGLSSSINAASDLNETISKTKQIFGDAAPAVLKFSKGTATSLGQTRQQALDAASTFATFGKSAGLAGGDLSKFAKQNTVLASDMASFFNTSPEEAINAIGSAFRGEAEPMRKYGVLMNDASLKAEALKQGLISNTKDALTPQNKVLAAQGLIMAQTKDAQGDFARTSGGLANQQRILAAQFEDVKAKIGTAFLPIVTKAVTLMNENLGPAIKAVGDFLAPLVTKVKEFFSGLGGGEGPMSKFSELFKTVAATVQNTIIPALTTLATYLISKIGPVFTQVVGIIQGKVIPIFTAVATFIYGKLVPAVVAIAQKVGSNLKPVFDQLVATFQSKVLPAINKLLGKLQEYGPTIAKVVTAVVKVAGAVLTFAAAILGKVLPVVIKFAGFLIGGLISAIGTAIGILVAIASAVVHVGTQFVDGAKKIGAFAKTVGQKIGEVIQWFRDLPGKIKGAFSSAGTMLTEIGKNIIQGLVNGLDAAKQWVIDKIRSITDSIPGWVKKRLGIASPSRVMKKMGKWVSIGLANGIEEGGAAVGDAMEKVTTKITAIMDKKFKKDKVAKAKAAEAIKSIKDEAKALTQNANARKKNAEALQGARADLAALVDMRDKELGLNKTLNDRLDENASKLDNARSALASLKEEALSYARAIKDNLVSFGNIANLVSEPAETTTSNIIGTLAEKVKRAKQFADLIRTLSAQGLNDTNLQQLIDSGAEAGLSTAQALAQGGPQAISEVNSLTAQLAATGQALGDTMSAKFHDAGINSAAALVASLEGQRAEMFNAGIATAQGLVEGFESAGDALSKAGERLARKLTRAIKKALKINSPSRVFKEIGKFTTAGLEQGLKDTTAVERASFKLGKAVENSYKTPTLSAPTSAISSNGAQAPVINISLDGSVVDGAKAGRDIANYLDTYYKSGGRRLAI